MHLPLLFKFLNLFANQMRTSLSPWLVINLSLSQKTRCLKLPKWKMTQPLKLKNSWENLPILNVMLEIKMGMWQSTAKTRKGLILQRRQSFSNGETNIWAATFIKPTMILNWRRWCIITITRLELTAWLWRLKWSRISAARYSVCFFRYFRVDTRFNKTLFDNLKPCKNHFMKIADGQSYEARGIGQVTVLTKYGQLVLKNVLFIPEFQTNFISLTQLMKQDISLVFKHKKAHLLQKGRKIECAIIKQGVLKLNTNQKHSAVTNVANSATSNEKWHKRFNNLNYDYLLKLKLGLSDEKSFDFDINQLNQTCHPCIEGKMRNVTFAESLSKANNLCTGYRIHRRKQVLCDLHRWLYVILL